MRATVVIVETQFSFSNDVLFIFDPSRNVSVPADTGAAVVTSTPDCAAVWALSEVDGETKIKLAGTIDDPPTYLVFTGPIDAPGRRIAISDSGGVVILELPVLSTRPHITIWVSDLQNPDRVYVQAV